MSDTSETPPMLTCQELAERASDHLDGALSFRQRLAVELHLVICPNCRAYMRQLRATLGLARRLGDAQARAEDETRLLALFDAAVARRK